MLANKCREKQFIDVNYEFDNRQKKDISEII